MSIQNYLANCKSFDSPFINTPQRLLLDHSVPIVAPTWNHSLTFSNRDHRADGIYGFEHLSSLFASIPVQHGIIAMTIRQTAYLFSTIRANAYKKVLEIGRYKGGSTVAIACAIANEGTFGSLDIGA